jgi:CRISPR-associated protein Csc3
MRLVNRPPKTLEERYFSEIRPLLYKQHGTHSLFLYYGVQ